MLKSQPLTAAEILGQRLLLERKRLRLTQGQVAEMTGVSRATVSFYESGSSSADARFLAEAMKGGMDVFFVLTGQRLSEEAAKHFDWEFLGAVAESTKAFEKRLGRTLDRDLYWRLLRVLYAHGARDRLIDDATIENAMELALLNGGRR